MNHKYKILEKIGEGAYGIVYKCKNIQTNELVAIKKFLDEYEKLPKKEINREIFTLQICKHENIVKLLEAFVNKGYLYLVFEYAENNLLQLIEEKPKVINQELIRSFTYQICKAVSYLHKKNIIHRDIKPENILIKDDSILKLCDFGFARKMKINENDNTYEKMTDYMATRWYRAPELILGQGNYGPEIDFWSIGCLIGEMATGNAMFPGDNQIKQLEYIIKLIGNLPENLVKFYNDNPNFNINKLLTIDKPETLEKKYEKYLTPDAIDFLKGLLELDPKKRLNAETVFEHKYFECYKDRKNERNTNNLLYSFSIDEKSKIKIPNFKLNENKKESKVINIFKYNDESFISDTTESTISKKQIFENKSNLMKLFQNKKRNHYRSDMVDFGEMFLLTEKTKNEEDKKEEKEKKESHNMNIRKNFSKFKPLKLEDNVLNHKISFSMMKNNNDNSHSNRVTNILVENKFPYLSPILLAKKKPPESIKIIKKDSKRINFNSFVNELIIENDNNNKIPFINKFSPESQKEINISKDKSDSKIRKRNNCIIDYKNRIPRNKYFKSLKMKSFENVINKYQDECITSKKIINLYENTFKNLILSTKDKRKRSPPSLPKKRKSVITGIFKSIAKKSLNNIPQNKKLELPLIYNFHSNDIIKINSNSNKYEKIGKDKFKYDFKVYNNRYKLNQL